MNKTTNTRKESLEDKFPLDNILAAFGFGTNNNVEVPKRKRYVTDEPVLYVIFNKTTALTPEQQTVIASHLTSKFVYCFNKADKLVGTISEIQKKFEEWVLTYGGYGNTVLLEADEMDIYTNINAKYNKVFMLKHIEDTERYVGNVYTLTPPEHTAFLFFGKKSDMPAWILDLPLLRY